MADDNIDEDFRKRRKGKERADILQHADEPVFGVGDSDGEFEEEKRRI